MTGKVYWEVPHEVEMGMTIPTPVHSGPYLFVTSQYGGARMLKLDETKPGATLLWSGPGDQRPRDRRHDTLDSVISTPVIQGDYVYGVEQVTGQLRCLELTTGKQVWETQRCSRSAPTWHRVLRAQRRPLLHQQRSRRADHRQAVAEGLRGDQPDEADRADASVRPPPRATRSCSWSHAAYANKHIIIRNDKEIIRVSLAKELVTCDARSGSLLLALASVAQAPAAARMQAAGGHRRRARLPSC